MSKYYTHKYSGEEIDAAIDNMNGGGIVGPDGSVELQGAINATQAARDDARAARDEAEGYVETVQQAAQDAQAVVDSFRPAEQERQENETARQAQEAKRQADNAAMRVWEVYDPDKQYAVNNKVSHNGSSYACKVACRGIMPPDDRCWVLIAAKGDKGERGQTGAQGARGETGERGATGLKGEQGERGPQGEQGIQGAKGDKGDTGPKGDSGGVTAPLSGFYNLFVRDGYLYASVPDGAAAPPVELRDGNLILTI